MPAHATGNDSVSSSLLGRLRKRDPDGWERFTNLYGPLIYAWCRRSGLSPNDAADLGQDVLFAISNSIDRFCRASTSGTFRGWVATITRNKITDHFRKSAKYPRASGGADGMNWLFDLAHDREGNSDSQPVAKDGSELVRRASELIRAEFEPATWSAFWMTAVEDIVPSDVAQQLGCSLNAVYKARSRVLKRLRCELDGCFNPPLGILPKP